VARVVPAVAVAHLERWAKEDSRMSKIKRKGVFLSHNSKDKPIASEIGLFLAAEGESVWFDAWKIPVGKSISASVSDALAASSHLLLLWSKNAKRSRWVRREVFAAISDEIESGEIVLVPVCLDKTPLPPLLRDLKYIRYEGGTEADRRQIISAILGRSPSDAFTKAVVKKYMELTRGGPRGLKACPECGSSALWWDDDGFPHCKECKWS
jgi:hypothetical protein